MKSSAEVASAGVLEPLQGSGPLTVIWLIASRRRWSSTEVECILPIDTVVARNLKRSGRWTHSDRSHQPRRRNSGCRDDRELISNDDCG